MLCEWILVEHYIIENNPQCPDYVLLVGCFPDFLFVVWTVVKVELILFG